MVKRQSDRLIAAARSLCASLGLIVCLLALFGQSSSAQAASDGAQLALDRINQYRAQAGINPVQINPALQQAATNHANYYFLNFGDPSLSGMGLHNETPGKPGFTGATMQERITDAGYSGSWNEGMALLGDPVAAVDAFMSTVNHRLPMIDPSVFDIGYGGGVSGKARVDVFTYGGSYNAAGLPEFVAYPADGQTDVPTTYRGDETNAAFPGASYPVGMAITLKYTGAGALELTQATISDPSGAAVPTLNHSNYNYATRNVIVVAATKPLGEGATYKVSVQGVKNGAPFTKEWSFTTRGAAGSNPVPTPPPAPLAKSAPASAPIDPFQQVWQRADWPVANNGAVRAWIWGPQAFASKDEPYAQAAGGTRKVAYFDKGRMEINNPDADKTSPYYVTNGLLVWEMVAGKLQTGDFSFQLKDAPQEVIAGDARAQNPEAPSYAAMRGVTSINGDNGAPDKTGAIVSDFIDSQGVVTSNPDLDSYKVTLASYRLETQHNVADKFVAYLGQQGPVYENGALGNGLLFDWLAVTGFPISEPYWITTRIDGQPQLVLVQLFQRRTLTFIPSLPAEWQTQMGNVGQHYYAWRYEQ